MPYNLRNKEKQKEYDQMRENKVRTSVFGAPIISDSIKMTNESDFTISIEEIASMPAMEEQNQSRSRQF